MTELREIEVWQASDLGRPEVSLWVWSRKKLSPSLKAFREEEWCFSWGGSPCYQAFSGLDEPSSCPLNLPWHTRIREGFTQAIDVNVNLIQKHSHRKHPEKCLTKYLASCDPVNLIHKVNHHTGELIFLKRRNQRQRNSYPLSSVFYGWFMLKFDRKQQNSVKQLSFN